MTHGELVRGASSFLRSFLDIQTVEAAQHCIALPFTCEPSTADFKHNLNLSCALLGCPLARSPSQRAQDHA